LKYLQIRDFFNKRVAMLKKSVAESAAPVKRLKTYCTTRWIERHETILTFSELLPNVTEVPEEIQESNDATASSKASSLLAGMSRGNFRVPLEIAVHCLALTVTASRELQNDEIDISAANDTIQHALTCLRKMREFPRQEFSSIFAKATSVALLLGVEIGTPRITGRQAHRANIKASSAEEYFLISAFIPFIDHLISQLEERFNNRFLQIIALQSLIPSRIGKNSIDEVVQAAKFYETDVLVTDAELKNEIIYWTSRWANAENPPKDAVTAMAFCDGTTRAVRKLLQLFATLPVSTAPAERSFSSLRLLKTYLRSTVTQERLSGLALCHIHRDITLQPSKVIDRFSRKNPIRMQFVDWSLEK
jgi:hypothetical protein